MIINKEWAMPSKDTFTIKPIKDLIIKTIYGYTRDYEYKNLTLVDPFAGNCGIYDTNLFQEYAKGVTTGQDMGWNIYTNDLNPNMPTNFHMDALHFLESINEKRVDIVLLDPPYSPRQVSECYKGVGKKVTALDTSARFWGDIKKEVARIAKQNSIVITCGWNSNGIGKNLGFEQTEILLVAHGGWHNDTIVTVERKVS